MNFNSTTIHLVFLLIFIVAFFPPIFNLLVTLPFKFLSPFNPSRPPTNEKLAPPPPICSCISPPLPSTSPTVGVSPPPTTTMSSSSYFQKTFSLPPRSRGSYLVTDHIVSSLPEIRDYKVGILHLFIQHTSCALSLNENWDSDVREDMSDALDRIAPEDRKGTLYRHSAEGVDDMPAHIKSALIGASISVPITDGRLNTGTWQGIWYLEFRRARHERRVVATVQGEKK